MSRIERYKELRELIKYQNQLYAIIIAAVEQIQHLQGEIDIRW